ncbi:hypothetical protein VRU48_12315 [Pedobacter sp. KR3-3]|uniref:General secretion pathway protein GspM n=1 Tax=Pedobacter albus TaxID=3113905 RepID=A0ABU7I9D4_9SPHI|nr:hypothetical protein [Pedobacter sp. KR3-3]MEE1945896.1 hypothetical protein [Pedobacter sp. KR3-3]
MWKNLDHQKKNWVLMVGMVALLYIAYVFSLKHTFEAMRLNRQLKKEQSAAQSEDSTFPQVSRKNTFYANALKSYQVKKEDRENRLWQTVSGMASAQNVQVNFSTNTQSVTDTIALQQGMVAQQFTFKGNYFNLVKLLDTLSKSTGIGKIGEMKLSDKQELGTKEKTGQLTLQLTLNALEK